MTCRGATKGFLLFTLVIFPLLTACEGPNAMIGRGELTLTQKMRPWLKNKEGKEGLIAVSVDGAHGYVTYCKSATECEDVEPPKFAIQRCEVEAGKKCYIYMIDGQVVWNFDTPSSIQPTERRPPAHDLAGAELCAFALGKDNADAWNLSEEMLPYTDEAIKRGYNPKQCQAYGLDEEYYCILPGGASHWMKRRKCFSLGGTDGS